ncbi:amidohydrolase family protein [Micromonospora sp. M12]
MCDQWRGGRWTWTRRDRSDDGRRGGAAIGHRGRPPSPLGPARHPQPWIDPHTMAAIDDDFTPVDLAPATRAAGVTQTVVVQSVAVRSETPELLGVAADDPLIAGVVGWVDLTAADVDHRLDRLRSARGGERLVGIRHLVQSEPDPAYLDRPDVRRGIAAVVPPASPSTC